MSTNFKALLVILALALAVFHFAKPVCLRFISEADYSRRKNVWLALTVTAFLSPSFWIYVLAAFVVAYITARKDSNPIALFVMLMHVIPSFGVQLPAVFINKIFEINNFRVLELAILLPVAWSLLYAKDKKAYGNHKTVDRLILLYCALQIVLLVPYEDFTNTIRRSFLFTIDSIILVYVTSRTCNERKKITEVMATFCLVSAIFVMIALFEYLKVWLVYTGFAAVWDIPSQGLYLFRDGALRAQASAGHSLVLGYLLAIALGFWLFFKENIPSKKYRILGTVGLCAGLVVTLSRGPWLTALFVYTFYTVLRRGGIIELVKKVVIAAPFFGLALLTPLGPKIIDKLPFVGSVDSANVEYRQRLAESSWELIKANPFFGDPFYQRHLEHMRQGEGIIDMVNVYASIALLFGVVGLLLFIAPLAWCIFKAWIKTRSTDSLHSDTSNLGRALVACMLGTAFFIATASFIWGVPVMYYLLIGLAAAYSQLKDEPTNGCANNNKDSRKSLTSN